MVYANLRITAGNNETHDLVITVYIFLIFVLIQVISKGEFKNIPQVFGSRLEKFCQATYHNMKRMIVSQFAALSGIGHSVMGRLSKVIKSDVVGIRYWG